MTDKITAPGIYDIPIDTYHDEPCAEPSISSSGLSLLLNACPAKYWWVSAMNPERPKVEKPAFSIGKAAHDLILQGDKFAEQNFVLPADCNLRTNAGKAIRDEALEAGKNVISDADFATIAAMRDELHGHDFAGAAFVNGEAEKSLVWRDPETDVWLRCRPDFLPAALLHIPNYKTARSAKPATFIRHAYDFGYHMGAALYLDGIAAVTGTRPRSYYFVVQEKEPPYLITCITLDPIAIEWARIQNRKAIHTFADCVAKDEWPGYERDVVEMPLPKYAEFELERQHTAGRFDVEDAA